MINLEKMREEVNQAYRDAVNCPCYRRKRDLLKKFYEKNSKYNEHKAWIRTLQIN